jgi:hypothetical protein
MAAMYNKLFTSILDSSIWCEDDGVIRIWVTLLAVMDENGFCKFGGIQALARRANKTPDATAACIHILESPDKYDPEQEYEGRRIEKVPGGWVVLNAVKYRDMATRAIALEKNRQRVQKFRAAQKGEPYDENAQQPQPIPRTPRASKPRAVYAGGRPRPDPTLGLGEINTPYNPDDTLAYWRKMREQGQAIYTKECPAGIRKQLEAEA